MNQTRKKKLGVVLLSLLVLYGVIGFAVVPMIVKHVAPGKLTALLNRPVSMDSVRFNPFAFSAGIRGLSIGEKGGREFVHVGEIHVNLQPLESILTLKPVVKIVRIDSPRIRIALDENGKFNFADMMPPEQPAESQEPETEPGPQQNTSEKGLPVFLVHEFILSDGRVTFSDRSASRPFDTVLHPIDLQVLNITGRENQRTYYRLDVKTESDESISLKGEITLADLGLKGRLAVREVSLAKYAPYYAQHILFDISNGRLDLEVDFKREPEADLPKGLTFTIGSGLKQLELVARGEETPFLSLPGLDVRNAGIDMDQRTIHVKEIDIRNFFAAIKRDSEGRINMAGLVPPGEKKETAGDSAPEEQKQDAGSPGTDDIGWRFDLDALKIRAAAIRWEDAAIESPATLRIDGIESTIKGVSNHRKTPADMKLSLRIENNGRLEMNGTVGIQPPGAEIALSLQGLELKSFQPYVAEYTHILLTGGTYGIEGNIHLADAGENGMETTFEGQTSLTNFGVVEADQTEDMIGFKSLWISKIKAALNPLDIQIGKIALTDYAARILVHPDGSLNLAGIIKKTAAGPESEAEPVPPPTEPEAGAPPAKEPPPNIRIDDVTLQGGELTFTDRQIQPRFVARLHDLSGRISGLSSRQPAQADLDITGTLDRQSPLKIAGKINPLIPKPFIDLNISFDDIGMPRFSPYTGKYIGQNLERGNLFLNLEYELIDNKLKGENRVVFDRLTLGETVESKDALTLPLSLILAILTDRNGKIEIDLPIQGELDNPEFRFGKQLVKILVNFLTKVATSPFAALGSLFGGEDISHLEYPPGESMIGEADLKKIQGLALALYERPALKLEIRGAADPEKDAEALKRLAFENRLKTARRNEFLRAGRPDQPLSEINLTEEERGLYIKTMFDAAEFPKPRNDSGALKVLPIDEKEKLLLAYTRISEEDLRQLAMERANHVRDEIMKQQDIEAGRIFLVEPVVSAPDASPETETEPAVRSRVDFILK